MTAAAARTTAISASTRAILVAMVQAHPRAPRIDHPGRGLLGGPGSDADLVAALDEVPDEGAIELVVGDVAVHHLVPSWRA